MRDMRDPQDIYRMTQHEDLDLWDSCYVLRVPGGWIYRVEFRDHDGRLYLNSTFVPYSDEFSPF